MPSILSSLCLGFPTQIPPVLFLFINNPEKDPKVSISLNAIYISSLDAFISFVVCLVSGNHGFKT
jgi:hypothetical protein